MRALRLLAVGLALLIGGWSSGSLAQEIGPGSQGEQAPGDRRVVGGIALEATTGAGWPIYYDRELSSARLGVVKSSLEQALVDVPDLTGLPPFATPLAMYVLADQDRFRLAMAEIANVRIVLVALDVGGYTIERGGTMLIFFPQQAFQSPENATYAFSHELAHLAVREASQGKPVPQWFNEGYAEWISQRAIRRHLPEAGEVATAIDRAVVASAYLSRGGLLPWADLVNRTRFSRAGVEGYTNLAYSQSTLLMNWLAQRHGADALARFLLAVADAPTVTQAFEATLGPFGSQIAAFEAEMAGLTNEFGPGLKRLTARVEVGRPVVWAVIGGRPDETVSVQLETDGVVTPGRERTLDAAGFTLIGLGEAEMRAQGRRLIRVTSASLGVLEAEIVVGAEVQPPPRPAPVQLPSRSEQRTGWPLAVAA